MKFRGGDRVRVPSPDGEGMVPAIYVTAEPGNGPQFAWVRYAGGHQAGVNAKVLCDEIERG
jgi:hypothetical protein